MRRICNPPCGLRLSFTWVLVALAAAGGPLIGPDPAMGELSWVSPDHYRILLQVDPRGVTRSNSPASIDVDLVQALADQGGSGTFDENTVEVVAYDGSGAPRVYDASRVGYEQYLLPWRIDRYWGINRVTLNFVMPTQAYTQYAVYFDTVESGLGQPQRYHGLVGDGDFFREGYKRREIDACHFDCFYDLDGDGDLDLFKGGVEAFIYCYENVGGNRFVDRGRLTSGGNLLILPRAESNRAWMTVTLYDWDGDGDGDLFASFADGPYNGQIAYFENTTTPGGHITFADRGPIKTQSGASLYQGAWFPAITFIRDWDGDGDNHLDALVSTNNSCYLHRNVRLSGSSMITDNPVAIQAGGADIVLSNPRFDAADIDGDGDLDLFAGTQPGPIYMFLNTDTTVPRRNPTFATGQVIAFADPIYIGDAHSAVKVADFTGDGLPDFVVGRFWERVPVATPEAPRDYGALYENVGTPTAPQFIRRDASSGAPYTEGFQMCDAIRQNDVRACDWNNDGKKDLIAADTDGHLWYFRNLNNNLFPFFATGERIYANGQVLSTQDNGGYARHDICDWNNDGRKDLLVADGGGWVRLFLNSGTDAAPVFGAGQRLSAAGSPIARGGRASVLACDWNNDGKKDLVFADQDNGYVWFRNTGSDASPVLAAAQSLGLNYYTRPNLGSFVDWDGDGKKDFIACCFENDARFYKNTGSGAAGTTPTFSNLDGVIIVQPFTSTQMVSGADAIDWRGDGDLDILTGQGHGGSGLRFYERDYINDFVNDTYPTVTVLTPDTVPPGNVNPLRAYRSSSTSVLLTWVNPTDSDFVGTMVRYRTDGYPTSASDGTLVCDRVAAPGSNDAFAHTLPAGPAYYTAFSYDLSHNYAGGVEKPASVVWLDDAFDSYGDGSLDGQGGWSKDGSTNSCIVQSPIHAGTTGKAVELFGTNIYDGASLANFGALTSGYHKFSFDMTRTSVPAGNQAIIEIYGSGQKITRVYWSGNYNILTGPGANINALVTSPTVGQWYHIEIGVNLTNGTIDAWADGIQKIFALPFYQSSTRIDTITLTGYSSATAYCYLDNLKGRRIDPPAGPADFDQDGDVDQNDLMIFESCAGGPGTPYSAACPLAPDVNGHVPADFDGDDDVDQADFGRFQRCLSGESVPADPNCAN
jgi:hypothetical protein